MRLWPAVAALVALVPMLGAWSTTNVFYVRDLGMYFWPRHLWLRHAVLAGDWPLWDRYAGAGQSGVADALNQFFLLPVLLVRLILPDVPGFNFWIAAPFPIGAIGAWLWLRRHASPPAACVGAALYSAAGPIVSTGNFPNLSWSVALIPWVLLSCERLVERWSFGRVTLLALCVACQALAGEPVTLAATGVLALTYPLALNAPSDAGTLSRRMMLIGAGFALGGLLASVQLLPLLSAAAASPRDGSIDGLFWSLHPLELPQVVLPHVFGHPYEAVPDRLLWLVGIHGREPLLFTIYVGVGAIVLALVAPLAAEQRRWRRFWWCAAAVSLTCALGENTAVYPTLQTVMPVLQSFRFPVKYVVFCMLALAALATTGADALIAHARGRRAMATPRGPLGFAAAFAVAGAALAGASLMWPEAIVGVWEALAARISIDDSREAAAWLLSRSTPLLTALAILAFSIAVLITVVWRQHRFAPAAAFAVAVLAVLDPLAVNRDVHPTAPASSLGPPSWLAATHAKPEDRIYVGGRVSRLLSPRAKDPQAIDALDRFDIPAEYSAPEAATRVSAQFASTPAAWHMRESISYDLPALWPREYAMMLKKFRWVSREERMEFLRRTGVRYCYLPEPPTPGMQPLTARTPLTGPMSLYECGPAARRVYVTGRALVEPEIDTQLGMMFSTSHDPAAAVLLERNPPAGSGVESVTSVAPGARVTFERNTEFVVQATVGSGGGYLNVLDSYDPWWRVEVDGASAPLLRANGLFRAVRLVEGTHEVRFSYEPAPYYAGLGISATVFAGLVLGCGWERLTRRSTARRMRQDSP